MSLRLQAGKRGPWPCPCTLQPADTIKLPYTVGRICRLQLIPGSPFVVELPAGAYATNIWREARHWMAELKTPKGSPLTLY
jgi:hypothetical protein